jgi:hypothetical protein
MTPKEKAIELVDKFNELTVKAIEYYANGKIKECKEDAIECALITVDELLEDKVEIDGMRVINDSYWMEVKQELLNLKNK